MVFRAWVERQPILRAGREGERVGGEVSLGGRRKVREFLPEGFDVLSEEECSDTLVRVRVQGIGWGVKGE